MRSRAHEFLLAHVAREIAERVALMLRPFPLALDLGAYHGLLGRNVARLPSVGATIYAESVFEFAALCPRPSLVCDEDLLPFKEASLNLIVSGLAFHRVNDLPGALIQIGARCSRRLVHGGVAWRGRAPGASPRPPRSRGRDARRSEPADRALRRCEGLWRASSARGLCTSGRRCRDAHLSTRTPRELMREIRALGGGNVLFARSRRPLSRKVLERAEAFTANATRCRRPRRRDLRDRLSLRLGARSKPAKAAQTRQRRAASRRCARHQRREGRR